jgi:two-component system sensor histidine kinase DevS
MRAHSAVRASWLPRSTADRAQWGRKLGEGPPRSRNRAENDGECRRGGGTRRGSKVTTSVPSALVLGSTAVVDDDLIGGIVDAAPDAILVVDDEGQIALVNRQTEVLFGYGRDELVGCRVELLLPEALRAAHRAHREAYLKEPRTRPMGIGMTLVALRKDETEFPVEVSLSPLPNDDGRRTVAVVRDITERLAAEALFREAAEDLRVLEDRERIARDLHDLVIQRLFAAGMTLQATRGMTDDPDVTRRVDAAVDELDATIREIRTVIFGLQPNGERTAGLRRDVAELVAAEGAVHGFTGRVRFDGVIDALPDALADDVRATLREALSNVGRHAQATTVDVELVATDEILLTVVDDGVGIPLTPALGHGIVNMMRRATDHGGICAVTAAPRGGTHVEWRVPNG